jgi:hypothetical protein
VGGYKLMDVPKNHPLYEKIIIDDSLPDRYILELDLDKLNTQFEGFLKIEYHINPKKVNKWL